jgi:hypothetical protein
MAATRIVSGVQREIWQETTPQAGGPPQGFTTGIRASAQTLSRVRALLSIDSVTGTPSPNNSLSLTADGFIHVSIGNGNVGSSVTWTLDIELTLSTQQANDPSHGPVVQVAYSVLAGGLVSTETLSQAYALGAAHADQTMSLTDAKGGGPLIDGSGAGFTTGPTLEVRQNALHDVPLQVSRYINQVSGPDIQLYHSRGTAGAPLDIQVGDELGSLQFSARFGGAVADGGRITAVCIGNSPNFDTALDFYVANRGGGTSHAWRMNSDSVGATPMLIGYNFPIIVPSATNQGLLGQSGAVWNTIYVTTADVYGNVCLGGATPGAGATHTVVLPVAGAVAPAASVGLAHVYALTMLDVPPGEGGAALAWSQEAPVEPNGGGASATHVVPVMINGAPYYLLAFSLLPG